VKVLDRSNSFQATKRFFQENGLIGTKVYKGGSNDEAETSEEDDAQVAVHRMGFYFLTHVSFDTIFRNHKQA
jgi:hypothetical protein